MHAEFYALLPGFLVVKSGSVCAVNGILSAFDTWP